MNARDFPSYAAFDDQLTKHMNEAFEGIRRNGLSAVVSEHTEILAILTERIIHDIYYGELTPVDTMIDLCVCIIATNAIADWASGNVRKT